MRKASWNKRPRTADLAVDLGGANTVIVSANAGVLFDSPTCVAVQKANRKIIAVGAEAISMDCQADHSIEVVYPINKGKIIDPDLLYGFLSTAFVGLGIKRKHNSVASIPLPYTFSMRDRNMLERITRELGISKLYFLSDLLAAAVTHEDSQNADDVLTAVLDIGADISSWGIVRNGRVEYAMIHEFGASDLHHSLSNLLQSCYGIKVGKEQAANLLVSFAHCEQTAPIVSAWTAGKDPSGKGIFPHVVNSGELMDAISSRFDEIIPPIKGFIDSLPENLLRRLLDGGLYFCGGCALIPNVSNLLSQHIGVPVSLASSPLHAPAIGAANTIIVP